ncbi:N-acetylmuramoyl-L-alanine amidase, partial [Globicatella sanguinis]|uniref:N-acetylmuramoyl-L-alanine amidase n=1 Tax=Globicatella sanguinis TaxID=13076 RepID=UPI001470061F
MWKYPKIKVLDLFSKYTGIYGNPVGLIYHNDAGSPTGLGYEGWLRNSRANSEANAALGFAHEYISTGEILQVQPLNAPAWAAANSYYNNNIMHIEICQQLSANDAQFKANEEYAFMRGAELCHKYGIKPDKATIKLHRQVSNKGTECPKRSAQLHGGYDKVQEYFIARTKHYMSLGKAMKEMIDKLNGGAKVASDSRYIELRPYSSNAKAFDKLEVGQKVTIRKGQTFWYDPQSGKGIKPSGDFTGDTNIIERVMNVEVGYSRRAYLLKGKYSWILEQDLVEARKSWEPVKVDDEVQPTIPQGKNYAFIDGKYYDVSLRT